MPRKKKPDTTYRLQVKVPVNGRVHTADIVAVDEAGKVRYRDQAKLSDAKERDKAVDRLIAKLKLRNRSKVMEDLEREYYARVEDQRRRQEEEEAKASAPAQEGAADPA
jgi:hypothetical protein